MRAKNYREFFKLFPDDETCLKHLMKVRFGSKFECPKCDRKAKWYRIKAERAYSCQFCGHHIHPTVGTPFEGSSTPLQLWFYAIYLFTVTRSGMSAKQLQRQLGVTYKCAWRMGHKIREHMANVDGDDILSGTVEVDESYIGGYQAGMLAGRGKTVLFGMLEKGGDVMTRVVPNSNKATLEPIIFKNVAKGSAIHSDKHHGYKGLKKRYTHTTVNHGKREYVAPDGTTTNGIEGYWSRLQNSIKGTHVHVSPKHLFSYAGEFEYRHNARNRPESMLSELLTEFPSSKQ